jgi:hypothetical protein
VRAPCEAVVYKRDTYRISRGRGFRMHYTRGRCSRAAATDGLCTQHHRLQLAGRHVARHAAPAASGPPPDRTCRNY